MFKKIETTWEAWTCENDHLIWDLARNYKWCPQCGGRLAMRKTTGEVTICDKCQKEISTLGIRPAYCPYCGKKG